MRYDFIVFMVGVAGQIIALIISLSTSNTGIIAYASVSLATVVLLFCGFWLISARQTSEILATVTARLPPVAIIKGDKLVANELTQAAASANEYIYATGSAARDQLFLDEISKAVKERGVSHIRVLYRRHVRRSLKQLLFDLIGHENVILCRVNEDHFGYYLITETRTLLVLPSVIGAHMLLLRFDDRERAEAIRSSFEQLSGHAEPIRTKEQLEKAFADLDAYGS